MTAPLPSAHVEDSGSLRERVVARFSERALRDGIRAANMAQLARELRISPTTLYKLFPSKAALVTASVERWAREVGAQLEVDTRHGKSATEAFDAWVAQFARARSTMSRRFVEDLRAYPEAEASFRAHVRDNRARGRRVLRPLLRDGVDEDIAFAVCALLIDRAGSPEFAESLDTSRGKALRTAMEIWARGALELGRVDEVP